MTVLADLARRTFVLAFTSADSTRYIAVSLRGASVADAKLLSDLAFTVLDGDLSGDESSLAASSAVRLLRTCDVMAPGSTTRLRLSGAHGEAVLVRPHELCVSGRRFDLNAPFEWQPFVFHETLGSQTTVFQATWVGQAGVEVLLVAPMPSEFETGGRGLARDRQKDLKLLTVQAGVPPQGVLRVAIERFFMLPVRSRLDGAAFARRAPLMVHKVRPERRLS